MAILPRIAKINHSLPACVHQDTTWSCITASYKSLQRTTMLEKGWLTRHPKNLSTIEQELCQRMDMVEIQGKAFRKIALLIPPDVKPAMNILANETIRDQTDIMRTNMSRNLNQYLWWRCSL